jgi:hypothetical protein
MTDQPPAQRIALVVGVNNTSVSAALPALKYAEEDAWMNHRTDG